MSTSFATEIVQNLNENQENIGHAADSNGDAAATEQTAGTSTDSLLFPTLRAVFGALEGDVNFSSEGDAITTRDLDAIDEFVKTHDEVWASVVTSTGEVAGRVFSFDSEDAAHEFAVANDKSTIAFERDGEVRVLFYATSANLKLERHDSEVDSIPLPVGPWTIYEGSLEFVLREPEAPQTLNDAILIGEVSPVAEALELKLGFGRSRQDKRWPAKSMTYLGLMQGLSKHAVGGKDGTAFMQGTAIGNERKATAIDALCVMGLDVDSGIRPEKVVEKVSGLGLTSIIYTTASNMKSETFLVEASFNHWRKREKLEHDATVAPEEHVRRYLLEALQWEQWIVDTVKVGERKHTGKGMGWALNHAPMPKFRVVFPLNEPFVIAKQAMSQADAIALWKRKIVGLAQKLELPIDEACLDPSRLFYLPRHAEGMPFGVWITGGDALDFQTIPEGKVKGRAQKGTGDKWQDAGADMTREKKPHVITNGGFDLTVWAAKTKASENFDIAALFQNAAPGHIRADQSDTKKTVDCPFETHSNAGDSEDTGCYVENPRPGAWALSFNAATTAARTATACRSLLRR